MLDESSPNTIGDSFGAEQTLPEDLPAEPFGLFTAWFNDTIARRATPNPDAFVLATAGADGAADARTLLCKAIHPDPGFLVFYTNRSSPKGRQLAERPWASAVFHWDHFTRQVRVSGPVVESPPDESDGYFRGRHWASRLGAWASDQSRPIGSREELLLKVGQVIDQLGIDPGELVRLEEATTDRDIDIPRPDHWGGYRLWAQRIELWCGGNARVHDRAAWWRECSITSSGEVAATDRWQYTRLQP